MNMLGLVGSGFSGLLVTSHVGWFVQWLNGYDNWKQERTPDETIIIPLNYRQNIQKTLSFPTFSQYSEEKPLIHPMVSIWRHYKEEWDNGESCVCMLAPLFLIVFLVGVVSYIHFRM